MSKTESEKLIRVLLLAIEKIKENKMIDALRIIRSVFNDLVNIVYK